MKKIPSLFVREYSEHDLKNNVRTSENIKGKFLATEQVTPGCEWVLAGEGVATRKWDGTAVKIEVCPIEGILMSKRFDAKHGKPTPPTFEACQDPDPITGHWPGWVYAPPGDPANKWLYEAFHNTSVTDLMNEGTFEAIGPKINGNKDKYEFHCLKPHGKERVFIKEWQERDFRTIRNQLATLNIEGIVYHHPDGRMCKVKRSDFGLKW